MKRFYELAKRAILLIIIVLFSMMSFAATYYVSNTTVGASDSNNGLSPAAPWKTLSKVNSANFAPGDFVLFKRGDIFFGTLTVKNSGISGNPITYFNYGAGNLPVISGFETLAGWVNTTGKIWEANTTAIPSTLKMLTIDGVNTTKGRYPNSGYLTYESSTIGSITDNQLAAANGYWTGAEAVIRVSAYRTQVSSITDHTGTTLTINSLASAPSYANGYFIQNTTKALDIDKEWCITTGKISMYSLVNPSVYEVKAAILTNCIAMSNQNYVTIDGLNIQGANTNCISVVNGSNIIIQNCELSMSGLTAVNTQGTTAILINNNNIHDTQGISIYAPSSTTYATISNNSISNVALLEGMTTLYMYNAIFAQGNNSLIEYNTINNLASGGIFFKGNNSIVRYNTIDNYGLILTDCGGIYTDQAASTGRVIQNNIVVNGQYDSAGITDWGPQTVGIYLDEQSANVSVSGNTIANINGHGIVIHSSNNNTIQNNTVYNCLLQQITLSHNTVMSPTNLMSGNAILNNVFVAKESNQLAMYFASNYNDLSFGSASGNVYARPIDDNQVFKIDTYNTTAQNYNLAGWKTLSKYDANSTKSPQAITNADDLQFEYNASKSPVIITLSQPMIDMRGAKYSRSITLQPYTSIVMMKDNNVAPILYTEYKSICDGTNYNGWAITGKYERKLTAASGADSIVTTYLTVNPKYAINEEITIQDGENYNGWTKSGVYTRNLYSISGCDSIVTTNLIVASVVNKQGNIAPVHFSTVWQSQTGINYMNLMVVSATLEDLPLTADDEIALYDGNSCVGVKRLGTTINPADNTTFLNIPASQKSGLINGFTDNDTIIIKIWDHVNQKEMFAKAITYHNDISTWTTSGKYISGATAVAEIVSYTEYTQTIELKAGYNMISTYVTAPNETVGEVVKPLRDAGSLIKIQDEAGNSFENYGTVGGGWIDNVGIIEKTEGYKIRVANNCTLQVTGRPIALPLDIPLTTGWNIISFPRTDALDAMSIIQTLIDQNKLVKVQDEAGNSIENWGIFGGWKNGIGNFFPGKAYKVKMNSNAILTLQQSYTKSSTILANTEKTEYFISAVEGNGTDHMNINLVSLRESGISVGDELAAFDGEICVGTLKITENDFLYGSASLVTSFSTDDKYQDGFKVGDPIQIYAWNQLSGNESKVLAEVVKGQMNYEKNASVMIKLKSLTTGTETLSENLQIDVFPNPSTGRFTVRFSQLPEAGGQIDILDISGRKISSRLISETSERFDIEGQPAGIYLVKSILGSNEIVQKLIIN